MNYNNSTYWKSRFFLHSHKSYNNSWHIVTFEMLNPYCFQASIAFFDSWICNDFINDLTLTKKTRIKLWLCHGHLQYLTQTLYYGTLQKVNNSVLKPNQLDFRGWVGNWQVCQAHFYNKRKWFLSLTDFTVKSYLLMK
jgi:hypothetical protein